MRHTIRLTVLFVYFLYFVSFLTGRPELFIHSEPATAITLGSGDLTGNGSPENTQETAVVPDTNTAPIVSEIRWSPGLVRRVLLIKGALNRFNDPLLESDAKPQGLFRELDRGIIVNATLLFLSASWSVLFLLLIMAVVRRYWFAGPMQTMTLIPSMAAILMILLSVRRASLLSVDFNLFLTGEILLETLLFFAGLALIYNRILAVRESPDGENLFMGHLKQKRASLRLQGKGFLVMLYEILLIGIVGLVLSNVLLLPIYTLQLTFPGYFGVLIVLGLAILALFYITAYIRVSRHQNEETSPVGGISFLGYRFLANTIFLTSVTAAVLLVIGVIIVVALLNVGFLESRHLLKAPEVF